MLSVEWYNAMNGGSALYQHWVSTLTNSVVMESHSEKALWDLSNEKRVRIGVTESTIIATIHCSDV